MAVGTWKFYLDWNKSGSFTDASNKDVSAYVKEIRLNRGKSGDFVRYVPSTAEVTVVDANGYWGSENNGGLNASDVPTGFRTTLASYTQAGGVTNWLATSGSAAAGVRLAQGIKVSATRPVDRIDLNMVRTGSPAGTATLYITTDDTGLPKNPLLAGQLDRYSISRSVGLSTLPTTAGMVTFTFERPPILVTGTQYHMVLTTAGYTRTVGVTEAGWRSVAAPGYADGQAETYDGTTWTAIGATDLKFQITANDVRDSIYASIRCIHAGTTYYLFYGRLLSVVPSAAPNRQDALLTFEDDFGLWSAQELLINIPGPADLLHPQHNRMLVQQTGASCMGDVLDALSLSAGQRDIDPETILVIWVYYGNLNAQEGLERIVEAGGGWHYLKAAAEPNNYKYTYRNHRYEDQHAADEDWSTGTQTVLQELDHRLERRQMANRVRVKVNPKRLGKLEDVWTYGAVPEVWGPGESRVIWAELADGVLNIRTPVGGVDFKPTTFTVVKNAVYGQQVKLTVTAPTPIAPYLADIVTLKLLKLRGRILQSTHQSIVKRDDANAQTVYGVVVHEIDNEFVQDARHADQLAARYVQRWKREQPDILCTRMNQYPSMLQRHPGDRVTVIDQRSTAETTGINGDYWIDAIEDTIVPGHGASGTGEGVLHTATYRLRKAGLTSHKYFAWEASLNPTAPVGFGWDNGEWAP